MEDFLRLHLRVTKTLEDSLVSGSVSLELQWENVERSPAIRIFVAAKYADQRDYLTDDTVASTQLYGNYRVGMLSGRDRDSLGWTFPGAAYRFPAGFWQGLGSDDERHLLFEAVGPQGGGGSGSLVLVLKDSTGQTLGKSDPVWMELKDIKDMYERYEVDTGALSIATASLRKHTALQQKRHLNVTCTIFADEV